MKFFRKNAGALLLCLLEVLVGVLLLTNPEAFTQAVITVFGAVLMVVGVVLIFLYFRQPTMVAFQAQTLTKGLVALCAGIFCAFQSSWILNVFPLITVLYGVGILVVGLGKIQWTADMVRMKTGKWLLPALSALLSVACALLIFFNPFETTTILFWVTGIGLIVDAVLDVVFLALRHKAFGNLEM